MLCVIAGALTLSFGLAVLAQNAEGFTGFATASYPASASDITPVQQLTASYNSSTGAVAVHFRFFTPYSGSTDVEFGTLAVPSNPGPGPLAVCSGAADDWTISSYTTSDAELGPSTFNSFPPPIPTLPVSETVDPDGLGVRLTVTSAALAHYPIVCAGTLDDNVYAGSPGPDAIFTIPLSVQDAESAFKKLLGVRPNSRTSTATVCRPLSETKVTCSTRGHRGKTTTSVTGSLSRHLGNLTIYASFVVHISKPCGRRICHKRETASASTVPKP